MPSNLQLPRPRCESPASPRISWTLPCSKASSLPSQSRPGVRHNAHMRQPPMLSFSCLTRLYVTCKSICISLLIEYQELQACLNKYMGGAYTSTSHAETFARLPSFSVDSWLNKDDNRAIMKMTFKVFDLFTTLTTLSDIDI